MEKFYNLKIMQKFLLFFLLILMSVTISYIIVFWFESNQKTKEAQLNIVEHNGMLSQKIGAMALLLNSDNKEQTSFAKEELNKSITSLSQTLTVLKNGGEAPFIEGNILLPSAASSVLPIIIEIEELVKKHKELAEVLYKEPRIINYESISNDSMPSSIQKNINPTFEKAFSEFSQLISLGTLLTKNTELTQIYHQQAKDAKNIFTSTLIIFLILNVFIIVFTFLLLRKTVSILDTIIEYISSLAQGNVPQPIMLERGDEIGTMALALNTLSTNLASATEFAKNVGDGYLDTQVEVFNGKGELSLSLYAMRNNLNKVAEEDKKRNWTTEGLAKFSEILRANTDLKPFSESIISNLVKYTRSNQGSLFVINDINPNKIHLELLACYAFNRKKHVEKTILIGEGLVGQAYLERETIFLTDVPQDYISITSGLGEANPNSILIVPLKLNEEIVGIVEIASFNEYLPHEIAFVEKLAENIASSISGTKINERTQRLLHDSQQQAEELKAQEEEMRQSMEELSSTQEEMERRNIIVQESAAEMTGVLNGINATMATIEFTPQGIVKTANENFLKTMKCSLEDIIGIHHEKFVPKEIKESPEYKTFWSNLASGKSHTGKFKRVNSAGEIVWLNAIYNPIKNAEGEIVKVVKFATDVTREEETIAETKGVLNGINTTMATIEFTPEGIVTTANENFLKIMKCSLQDIVGAHHEKFVPKRIKESPEYKTFWTDLATGEANTGKFERVNAAGETVWLNAIYNPIVNSENKVVKVIKLASNVA